MDQFSKDYTTFSVTEFILDEDFIRWVQAPVAEDDLFWSQWLSENPNKKNAVTEASALIKHLRFGQDYNTQENIEQTWNVISKHFHEAIKTPQALARPLFSFSRVAAVVGLLGLTGTFVWLWMSLYSTDSYHTGYGETASITLSDGSEIILNANTTVEVKMGSGLFSGRQVWLTGEAFFKVRKKQTRENFIVHTANAEVRVLGTEFSVYNRRQNSIVILQSGKVEISAKKSPDQKLIMLPGNLVSLADTSHSFSRQTVNLQNYLSWIHKSLIFDHTSIRDVAIVLEDTYGLSVVISKPALAARTFSATLPTNNLPVLLKALEESFNVNISQLDKKIIISDK